MLTIKEIQNSVEAIAPNFPVKKVELFGSYAEGQNKANSDIDLLVEFMTPFTSLLTISGLKISLEEDLNINIDIVPVPLSSASILEIGKVVQLYES